MGVAQGSKGRELYILDELCTNSYTSSINYFVDYIFNGFSPADCRSKLSAVTKWLTSPRERIISNWVYFPHSHHDGDTLRMNVGKF